MLFLLGCTPRVHAVPFGYERKSISNIDMVWLATPSARELKEFARSGLDIALRTGWTSFTIAGGSFSAGWEDSLLVDSKKKLFPPMVGVAFQANLAWLFGVPQLFLTLGISIGGQSPDGMKVVYQGVQRDVDWTKCIIGYAGITKKVYWRRFAFFAEPRYEVYSFGLAESFGKDDKVKISFDNGLHGLVLAGGVDLALRADLSIGTRAGLRLIGKRRDGYGRPREHVWTLTRTWTEKVGGEEKEKEEVRKFTGPELDWCGPFLGIQLIYSPRTWLGCIARKG